MKYVVGFLSGFIFSIQLWAGGVVSNPADNAQRPQIWFLGAETIVPSGTKEPTSKTAKAIQSCLVVSADHTLTKVNLRKLVKVAFRTWNAYSSSKRIDSQWPKDRPLPIFDIDVNLDCLGNEEVKFYFGAADNAVKKIQKSFKDPYGLSHLESYDQQNGRGKGFVWIKDTGKNPSPLWGAENEMLSLLMHEVGHMYGHDHVDGTIMRILLPNFLQTAEIKDTTMRELKYFALAIEHRRELYFSFDRGVRAMIHYFNNYSPEQRAFLEKLLNKKLQGSVSMGFIHGELANQYKAQLFVAEVDEAGKRLAGGLFNIELDPGSLIDFPISDSTIFRSVYKNVEHVFKVPGFIIEGKITVNALTGETIKINYTRNRGPNEYVRLLQDTPVGKKEVFRAYLDQQIEHY